MPPTTGDRAEAARERRRDETIKEFKSLVNMTASRIEKWLGTDESRSVGRKRSGESESVGHRSGRKIAAILRKRASEYDAEDLAHMRKVIGYVKRHREQRPEGDVTETRWRYSLMNWGHDPTKG